MTCFRGFLAAACLFAFLLPVLPVSAVGAAEAPRPLGGGADAIPVPRPGARESGRTAPIVPFLQAESEYAAGKTDEALSRFLDLAYSAPDDERKGFIWWRVGELLLVRGDLDKALEAADKAVLLSRAPYLSLSAVDLKLRIYQRMKWDNEARQMAAYLLDRKFVGADPPALLTLMARADAGAGKLGSALALYRRAVAADPQASRRLSAERESLIEGTTDLSVLRGAAEGEEDPEVRAHLYLAMGNAAIRKGFLGMAAHAFERSARAGGKGSQEAAEHLFRAEKIIAARPKIVGLVPLSGKLSDIGYAVLTGAEVALGAFHGFEQNGATPVIRWVDTAGQPEKARKEFVAAAADRMVLGVLGPVTGEEGRSVGAAFTQKSPPTLYLGQKPILEKPFLYGFGLSPAQEARALLAHMARAGISDLLLFHPENGYGDGFATAAAAAAAGGGGPDREDRVVLPGDAGLHGGDQEGGRQRDLPAPVAIEREGEGDEASAGGDHHRRPVGPGLPPCVAVALLQRLSPAGRILRVERPRTAEEGGRFRFRGGLPGGLLRRDPGVPGRPVPEGVPGDEA